MKRKKQVYQFQVEYMFNLGLKINKSFREQVESNLALTFSSTTIKPIRIVIRRYNTRYISFIIFY